MKLKTWAGDPGHCDICKDEITHEFVDGRMEGYSSWAKMCPGCHVIHGAGIGEGVGQLYQKQLNTWVKVRG